MYSRKYDNQLRTAGKSGSVPEQFMEYTELKEAWDKITALLSDEAAERKALAGQAPEMEDSVADDPESVQSLRKGPNAFVLHSDKYWLAVANQTVRTYVSLAPEPKTQEAVVRHIQQGPLKDISAGVLVLLDYNLLGESMGPGATEGLRRKYTPSAEGLRKLLHGAMLALGGQKTEDEQCTLPPEGIIVFLHLGDRSAKEARHLFRLRTARADAAIDAEEKEICIGFNDESMRARKKLSRGNYSVKASMLVYSNNTLIPGTIPEKQYPHHGGWNSSDLMALVKAIPPADLWYAARRELGVFASCCIEP